jgi:O-antigen/teichoic acid export membrane protein
VAEGLGLLLVVAVRRSAGEYLLGQLLAQAAAVTVALLVARPLALRRRDRPLVARTLRYSIPLLPAALAVFVLESSDRLVLQGQLGSTAVARYAIAYNIGSIPILLLGVLNNVWMPRMFALVDDGARGAVLAQSRDALYALLIPVLVGLGIGAPLLLAVWAPPSYRPAGLLGVVAIVLATAIPCSGASAHTRSLLAAGRTRPVAVATLLAAAVNLGLNLALVPVAGISGSALATLVSYGVYHAGLARPASRSVSLPWPSRALMAELGLAVAVIFGAAQLPATLPWLALRLLVAAACCAAFAAILLGLARVRRRRPSAVGAWIRSRTGVVTAG